MNKDLKIGVVGPCGAGKSTLIRQLKQHGLRVHHIAQEHSYVPHMWQRITNPDVLIFLDVSFAEATRRRSLCWNEGEYLEQQRRLSHAREHADLIVETDGIASEEVARRVMEFLGEQNQG